jgi:hypothetical protein
MCVGVVCAFAHVCVCVCWYVCVCVCVQVGAHRAGVSGHHAAAPTTHAPLPTHHTQRTPHTPHTPHTAHRMRCTHSAGQQPRTDLLHAAMQAAQRRAGAQLAKRLVHKADLLVCVCVCVCVCVLVVVGTGGGGGACGVTKHVAGRCKCVHTAVPATAVSASKRRALHARAAPSRADQRTCLQVDRNTMILAARWLRMKPHSTSIFWGASTTM